MEPAPKPVLITNKRKGDQFSIEGDLLEIRPLGAGQEVGRSCVLIKFRGKTIMLDCGIHPADSSFTGLPYFDQMDCDPSEIDLLLISHFHLDHSAGLPYFLAKTTFAGKVFTTYPTKIIYELLLLDYLRVQKNRSSSSSSSLFDEQCVRDSMRAIEVVGYHEEREHRGIRFWCYNAGHVLGAAMFMLEIAGVRILYTGDFSREDDRHLRGAELPEKERSPHVVIVESTYGVQIHEPREVRERKFTQTVHEIVSRGGRCLIPSFALGRAQELLLILEEHWAAHRSLQHVPIHYSSSLAKKTMNVFKSFTSRESFDLRFVTAISPDTFRDEGPAVVFASPAMLQSGFSRQLFEKWASDSRNGLIIPGYVVDGTLAKEVLHFNTQNSNNKEFHSDSTGLRISSLNLSVDYVSFSAHSDFRGTSEFLDVLSPQYVVLVHGSAGEMGRLKSALTSRYEERGTKIFSPKNAQPVQLTFRQERITKFFAPAPQHTTKSPNRVEGILVRRTSDQLLVSPEHLEQSTNIKATTIAQRLSVPSRRDFEEVVVGLSQVYQIERMSANFAKVSDSIRISKQKENSPDLLLLEWTSDPWTDMLADSVIASLMTLEVSLVPSPAKKLV